MRERLDDIRLRILMGQEPDADALCCLVLSADNDAERLNKLNAIKRYFETYSAQEVLQLAVTACGCPAPACSVPSLPNPTPPPIPPVIFNPAPRPDDPVQPPVPPPVPDCQPAPPLPAKGSV